MAPASPHSQPTTQGDFYEKMQRLCREFEDKFSFCPVDATPLNRASGEEQNRSAASSFMVESVDAVRPRRAEFHLTMIDQSGLADRLAQEFRYLSLRMKVAWPVLRSDPSGFARALIAETRCSLRRLATPNLLAAFTTALLVVLSVGLIVFLVDSRSAENSALLAGHDGEVAHVVEFLPETKPQPEDRGIGAGSKEGRVGFAGGRGEGSGPKPKKSSGGGTGGQRDPLPTQVGKLPPPSEIAAPIPKFPPVQKQTLPVAGIDIDPALWKNLPMAVYGDPRSKSSAPSGGPGDNGGMGTNAGLGIGEGIRGNGFGPGQDGNLGDDRKGLGCCGPAGSQGGKLDDSDRVYPVPQVSERARVLAKPEPQYTEEARRNAVSGSVVLRVVFSRTGEVTNIRALQSLPFGLTEKAIAAARMIRFRPATKDGRPVNVYMQLEYNFNLY